VVMAAGTGAPALPWQVPGHAWPGLIGIGVLATAIAIQAFYAGVGRIGAAQAALVSTLEPVFTVSLAVLLLGERLDNLQMLGAALVVVGVVFAQTGRELATEAAVAREA
jgi:drug/metabolite transporter (DMT)-like permease